MLKIIYENNDFLICEKPVGAVSEDTKNANSMCEMLRDYYNDKNKELYCVHRLDITTGGIMIYAKNKKNAGVLSDIISNKNLFKKTYLAVIHGEMTEKSGTMEDYLYKDSKKNKSFVVKKERKGVKKALLEYEVSGSALHKENKYSIVKIKLVTGRSHQIRVQFSSRGFPLAGDGKYGSKDNKCLCALWSNNISFTINETNYSFSSYPDFEIYPWNLFNKDDIMKDGQQNEYKAY